MKKHVTALFIAAFALVVSSAFTTTEPAPDVIKIELDETLMQGDWGPWSQTSCFRGLDFRVKYRGENYDGTSHKWSVQFRNRYQNKIFFNYEVYNSRPSSPRTTNRMDLSSGAESSGYRDFYMNNSQSIYVYVDKVRFTSDGLQDYYDCDK